MACVKLRLPWSCRVDVLLKAGQLRRRGQVLPLEAAQAWVLATGGGGSGFRYEISLEVREGVRWPVLMGSDPAVLLEQLARALRVLDLPVRRGWGLPDDAFPWDRARAGPAGPWQPTGTRPVSWPVRGEQHRITWALSVGTTLVALILTVIAVARIGNGEPIAAMSAGLALGLVVLLALIALAVGTERVTLSLKPRLAIRHHRFGLWTVSHIELDETQWTRAHIVESKAERHLLLETLVGLRAFPYHPKAQPPELQAVLARGGARRDAGHPSAGRTEAQHARLAL